MNTMTKKEIESQIGFFKSMIRSCFAYDSLSKDNSYIEKYKEILGMETFNQIYDEESTYLKKTFRVIRGSGTDHEGCVYNSLEEINGN